MNEQERTDLEARGYVFGRRGGVVTAPRRRGETKRERRLSRRSASYRGLDGTKRPGSLSGRK